MSENQILKDPPELERLNALRKKLAGADEDTFRELDRWEAKAKEALIALNLKGHEGIEMFRERANREIKDINDILTATRPKDLSPENAQQYANEAARLFDRKDLWEWFGAFFTDAETALNEVRADLAEQEAGLASETDS